MGELMGTWAGANSKSRRANTWASGGRKKTRRRRKKYTATAAVFGALTMTTIVVALTVQGTMLGIAAGMTAAGTAISGWLETRGYGPVPGHVDPRPSSPKSRGGGGTGPRSASGGTGAKPKASGKPRKRVCSARCRASTKPASECRCVCGSKTHGVAAAKTSA